MNKIEVVPENDKAAIYEKDVERFISTYASDIHGLKSLGKLGVHRYISIERKDERVV